MNLKEMIKQDEGLVLKPYQDTLGYWTFGYGQRIDMLDKDDAEYFLNKRILEATDWLNRSTWYRRLDDVRKAVCVNIVYNLGITGFMGFTNFIYALKVFNYDRAETELLDSKAAKQLPARYSRLANMIKTGEWPENY